MLWRCPGSVSQDRPVTVTGQNVPLLSGGKPNSCRIDQWGAAATTVGVPRGHEKRSRSEGVTQSQIKGTVDRNWGPR